MNIIPFRPSEKYMMIQLAPFFLLIAISLLSSWLWHSFLLDLTGLLLIFVTAWQMTIYCSELYILTARGLIICRGVLDKHIYWRSFQDFSQMRREQPGLIGHFDLFHLRLGLTGAPAERITLYGVDAHVLHGVLAELSQELNEQLTFMESHEWVPKTV
jgi:hypothetical protein